MEDSVRGIAMLQALGIKMKKNDSNKKWEICNSQNTNAKTNDVLEEEKSPVNCLPTEEANNQHKSEVRYVDTEIETRSKIENMDTEEKAVKTLLENANLVEIKDIEENTPLNDYSDKENKTLYEEEIDEPFSDDSMADPNYEMSSTSGSGNESEETTADGLRHLQDNTGGDKDKKNREREKLLLQSGREIKPNYSEIVGRHITL